MDKNAVDICEKVLLGGSYAGVGRMYGVSGPTVKRVLFRTLERVRQATGDYRFVTDLAGMREHRMRLMMDIRRLNGGSGDGEKT